MSNRTKPTFGPEFRLQATQLAFNQGALFNSERR
jgi:transposase-like protein